MSRDAEPDDDEGVPAYPLRKGEPKLSRTPSWVMLGFLVGAAWMYLWQRDGRAKPPEAAPVRIVEVPAKPAVARTAQPLSKIEAIWEDWGRWAVWHDNTTEVALWNSEVRAFADFYEVVRVGGAGGTVYFRTIPALTRRILTHGRPLPESPLQFTETEEQYREWLEHGRTERRVPATTPITPPAHVITPPTHMITPIVTPTPPRNEPPRPIAEPRK